MSSNATSSRTVPVGIVGAGSFGTALASLLAVNGPVMLYARNPRSVEQLKQGKLPNGKPLPEGVEGCLDLQRIAEQCNVLLPVVPSENFRELMKTLAPFLHPYHVVIHGTKGVNLSLPKGETLDSIPRLELSHIKTMSQIIQEESVAIRLGALAGPNLAAEIMEGLPAATLVASPFKEVRDKGQQLLQSPNFAVKTSSDLVGVELGGVLKNIVAIGAGMVQGLQLGSNALGVIVTLGVQEMIVLGTKLGAKPAAFTNLSGVGDLITTATSAKSRNYSLGYRMGQGQDLESVLASMEEVAEGVNTLKIFYKLGRSYELRIPFIESLWRVLFDHKDPERLLPDIIKKV